MESVVLYHLGTSSVQMRKPWASEVGSSVQTGHALETKLRYQ